MPSNEKTATMVVEKETRGAVKYQEVNGSGEPLEMSDPACVMGQAYVRKNAFNGKIPKRVTIMVMWQD